MKTLQVVPSFEYELPFWKENTWVIGIDEVGRGPLAGPVTVGAVCFPLAMNNVTMKSIEQLGINDSKKLSAEKRITLCSTIRSLTSYHAVSHVAVNHINQLGIMSALNTAATIVVNQIISLIGQDKPYILLIDGYKLDRLPYEMQLRQQSIIKGDQKCISIAAASILAKVERDLLMDQTARDYPAYEWQQNKGYGTAVHLQAIREHGITPHHRLQYVSKYI